MTLLKLLTVPAVTGVVRSESSLYPGIPLYNVVDSLLGRNTKRKAGLALKICKRKVAASNNVHSDDDTESGIFDLVHFRNRDSNKTYAVR